MARMITMINDIFEIYRTTPLIILLHNSDFPCLFSYSLNLANILFPYLLLSINTVQYAAINARGFTYIIASGDGLISPFLPRSIYSNQDVYSVSGSVNANK